MTETTSRLKIMLVEDDAGLAELETKRLQRSGYEVSVAYSATEAFKLLQTTKFDLILLDYRLPDCSDGLEFYSKMRTHGFDLPVILVTGFSNEAAAIRALR